MNKIDFGLFCGVGVGNLDATLSYFEGGGGGGGGAQKDCLDAENDY